MDWRVLPKIGIWVLLVVSSLGAVSQWTSPKSDETHLLESRWLTEQSAISAATHFAREWMTWDGGESAAERFDRLKPYVSPVDLARIGTLKIEKASAQQVISAVFVSLSAIGTDRYAVRVRVIARSPKRTQWELEVPVAVNPGKGTVITDPPQIGSVTEAPTLAAPTHGISAPKVVLEQMRPTVENFLKAMCTEQTAGNLSNYVEDVAAFQPLQGHVAFVSLDDFRATGTGPYRVNVAFTVRDAATGTLFPQEWKLRVAEQNQKYFVASME